MEDTICAIATPSGDGGIGIVRISGPGALSVAAAIVRLRSGHSIISSPPFILQLADICYPILSHRRPDKSTTESGADGELIDEGLVVVMRAPRSYTAEDVVELHCHGSATVLGYVCEACILAGARLAQPGEFTKRAFLNGRLDLSQAEAVLDTICAKSEAGLRIAQRHLRGELGRHVEELRATLVALLAHVEAGIDFVEEEITFIGREDLLQALRRTLEKIEQMLQTAKGGRVLREGARVVIVGRPNVGKSSLLNRLLQEERAIVTAIPGTTRDVIEEMVILGGLRVTLVDTAGLRDTTDLVELEGIKRAEAARHDADVVLHVWDACDLREGMDSSTCAGTNPDNGLVLLNKMDCFDGETARPVVAAAAGMTKCEVIPMSAHTGLGLDLVKRAIRARLFRGSMESIDGVVITNVRHAAALNRAATSLRGALTAVENGLTQEFVALDVREASDALGEITGAITSEEVLQRIFSEFCIGK